MVQHGWAASQLWDVVQGGTGPGAAGRAEPSNTGERVLGLLRWGLIRHGPTTDVRTGNGVPDWDKRYHHPPTWQSLKRLCSLVGFG
jgi:hypothetical protein